MRKRERTRIIIITVLTLFLGGCGVLNVSYTKIGALLAKPAMYAEKEVNVKGKVTNVVKIPFVETKIYSIRDDTGEIAVRTTSEPPLVGADVRVKGTLGTLASVGTENIGLHLKETERR